MLSLLESYICQALKEQLPDINGINPAESAPYVYTPLPDQHSIRLLQILPSETPEICGTLETFALKELPDYDALSYTWGDPRPPLFQSIATSYYQPRRRHRILCNGRTLHVTINLYHALQHLRLQHLRRAPTDPPKYIWIDALCINQEDLSERSAQVARMGEIYKDAQMVVAWLGKRDRYTTRALRLMTLFAQSKPEQIKQHILPNISSTDWEALVAFFMRAYFRRAWIVQEVVLAQKIVIFIGSEQIAWESLARASESLQAAGAWKDSNIMSSGAWTDSNIITSSFATLSHRMAEKPLPLPGTAVAVLSQLKTKESPFYGNGGEIPWYTLVVPLNIGRGYLATDQRDHFYASLGVMKNIMSSPNLTDRSTVALRRLPDPDYTKSVSTVFTQFAKWNLEISQNLSLLSMVEDRSCRSSDLIESLPSWVPDQSVALRPMPFDIAIRDAKWNPSLWDSGMSLLIESPEEAVLLVQGAMFDTIKQIAKPFTDMRKDAEGWISVLDLIKPSLNSYYPDSNSRYPDALWRTLIADSHSPLGKGDAPRQFPADENMARNFNEWLITHFLSFSGSPADYDNFNIKNYAKVSRMLLEGVWDQLQSDPEAFCSPSTMTKQDYTRYEEHERKIYQNKKHGRRTFDRERVKFITELEKIGELDESRTFFHEVRIDAVLAILKLQRNDKLRIHLLGRTDEFMAATKGLIDDRRLVLTDRGFLGIVAKSVAVGDQVWILNGLRTPFSLRPVRNRRYRLMGEAYVHGIMHGEAVKAGTVTFDEIQLE
jgi:hypothetical protein